MGALAVGVAGGSGSGKTTLTRALLDEFGSSATVLFQDNYYRRNDHLSYTERTQLNYDAPEAFDIGLMVDQIRQLKAHVPIDCPVYDFTTHNRSDETLTIRPASVVIVEGILLFAEPRLCELLDIRLFVDTDADVRILRRIRRDVVERGRSLESVEQQYLSTVKPMHELYVEPSKRRADLIVPEGGHNTVALDMIIHRIRREV